jgi:hypothetical protein
VCVSGSLFGRRKTFFVKQLSLIWSLDAPYPAGCPQSGEITMASLATSHADLSGASYDIARHGDVSLFTEMHEAYGQLEHEPLRDALLESLEAERESVQAIARGFAGFVQSRQAVDIRRRFFASWQKTTNSAMSVEGLANRMTSEAEAKVDTDPAHAVLLFRAAGRMNRVADDDLGVHGQPLHFELFYRMATDFSGGDDAWQSRQYCVPAALEFKAWLDASRLRSSIMAGLYSLLVHEGYTHAEFETVETPFREWATMRLGFSDHDARRSLAWITVHNGGTEKNHFAHSCGALEHYVAGSGDTIDLNLAGETFRKYFRMKGAVMSQLSETYG